MTTKITPFLWFENEAEDAAKFHCSVFPNSRIRATTRYSEAGPRKPGSVMTVVYELDGREFTAINGGPEYKITPAISFVVDCKDQKEVDHYWARLGAGGQYVQCGWLTDKFGVSWQVVPGRLLELIADPDAAKVKRVMSAMMKMVKLDIATLEKAAAEG